MLSSYQDVVHDSPNPGHQESAYHIHLSEQLLPALFEYEPDEVPAEIVCLNP